MKKLYLVLVFVFLTKISGFAQTYSGGTGTAADPFLIANKTDLKYLSDNSSQWGFNFKQTANIVFTTADFESGGQFYYAGLGFNPIGNGTSSFNGKYNGNGFIIENLKINRPTQVRVGLFGYTENSLIYKLGLKNVNIIGSAEVGGIAGLFFDSTLNECYATGIVTGVNFAGGICGAVGFSNLNNCYSMVNVPNNNQTSSFIGVAEEVNVLNCYAVTTLTNNGSVFLGYEQGIYITSCYYDSQTSGTNVPNGATPKTTVEMQTQSTFTGWDFTGETTNGTNDIWKAMTGPGYPILAWQTETYPSALAAPTATAQTFCAGATVANLVATGESGATFNWYTASSGGSALPTTTSLTTGTYYVSQTVSGNESARTSVSVTVNSAPANINMVSIDQQNLNTGYSGGSSTNWQSFIAQKTGFLNKLTISHATPIGTGNFNVTVKVFAGNNNQGAVLGVTNLTLAHTTFIDIDYILNNVYVIAGQTYTFEISTPTIQYAWMSVTVANNYVFGDAGFGGSPDPAQDLVFKTYVDQSAQTFCNGATVANLAATASSGNTLKWYDVATNGTALATTTTLVTGTYYVTQVDTNGCESTRVAVNVTVNTTTPPTASAQSFCATNNAMVSNLVATGTTLKWYDVATNGTVLASTTALVTGTYYVSQTVNGCESARTSVAVTITSPTLQSQTVTACGEYTSPSGAKYSLSGTYVETNNCVQTTYNVTINPIVVVDKYLHLDGTDYISLGSSITNSLSNNFTIEAMVFSSGFNNSINAIFNTITSSVNGSPGLAFYVNNWNTSDRKVVAEINQNVKLISNTALALNQWHHVAITKNGSTFSIYINGVLDISNTFTYTNNTTNAIVGAFNTFGNYSFSGGLDNIRIWNKSLTGTEINQSRNNSIFGSQPNLVANYEFNQGIPSGSNTTVTSLTTSTGSINGTLSNFNLSGNTSNWLAKTLATTTQCGSSYTWNGTTYTTNGYYTFNTTNATTGCAIEEGLRLVLVANPNAPTASAQSFCGSATVSNLVATGTNLQWYTVSTGGGALSTTDAVSTGTYYVSQTVSGCESTRTSVAVTVNTIPTAPTASPQSFCGSATVSNLVATGTNLQWYSASTGGTALASTDAVSTGTYYVSQTVSGCESTRTSVAVTVNTTSAPTALAQSFCGSATVSNLVATGTNLQWYAASTGGTALASTDAVSTGTYYVSQTISGCESTRTSVAVTVNTTSAPTASAQSFCGSSTVSNLVATGTNLQWYTVSTGGGALSTTDAVYTGTYYVSQTVSGCESTRTSVAVSVNTTTAPTASAQSFCGSATVSNLVATGTNLQWYAASTGGTALASTNAVSTGTYYVSQTVSGCESTRTSVAVTVNTTPTAPTASAQSLCSGSLVGNLVANGDNGATFNWYDVASDGIALNNNTVLVTGTYYVSQTVNGCESTRISVAVTINQVVSAAYTNNGYVFTFNQSGGTYEWYGVNGSYPSLIGTSQSIDLSSYVSSFIHFFGNVTVNGCTAYTPDDIFPAGVLGSTTATNAGNGSASQSVLPINFGQAKTQYLFTEADLDAAGIPDGAIISEIAWYVLTDNTSAPITFNAYAEPNFDLTTLATAATFAPTPAQQIGNMKIDGDDNSGSGWHKFTLDTQFAKVPGKSLLLQFCRVSGAQPQEDVLHVNPTSYNSAITGYFNRNCSSTTGEYTNNYRPSFRFTYDFAALNAEDFEYNTKLSVYPNPSNGIYKIQIDANATYEVYDMVGKQLQADKIAIGTSNLDLSQYNSGIYFLKVTNELNQTKTIKLIKQ
jgi:hypothetical protein